MLLLCVGATLCRPSMINVPRTGGDSQVLRMCVCAGLLCTNAQARQKNPRDRKTRETHGLAGDRKTSKTERGAPGHRPEGRRTHEDPARRARGGRGNQEKRPETARRAGQASTAHAAVSSSGLAAFSAAETRAAGAPAARRRDARRAADSAAAARPPQPDSESAHETRARRDANERAEEDTAGLRNRGRGPPGGGRGESGRPTPQGNHAGTPESTRERAQPNLRPRTVRGGSPPAGTRRLSTMFPIYAL